MQAPEMTYFLHNFTNYISKGGRMCSPWTWLGQEWPLWQIWIDFGQSGATMAWRISPRWVWEILFSFDFTTFVSGWDVQPWRRLLVLRSQHGVPRRRRWCWGDPNGLSQQHLVPMVIPMVWVNHNRALRPNDPTDPNDPIGEQTTSTHRSTLSTISMKPDIRHCLPAMYIQLQAQCHP